MAWQTHHPPLAQLLLARPGQRPRLCRPERSCPAQRSCLARRLCPARRRSYPGRARRLAQLLDPRPAAAAPVVAARAAVAPVAAAQAAVAPVVGARAAVVPVAAGSVAVARAPPVHPAAALPAAAVWGFVP